VTGAVRQIATDSLKLIIFLNSGFKPHAQWKALLCSSCFLLKDFKAKVRVERNEPLVLGVDNQNRSSKIGIPGSISA
jgi:hypothetical protein